MLTISSSRPYPSVPRLLTGLLSGLLLTACFVAIFDAEGAEEGVYRCEDGSFTNRPDGGCLPYRSQGLVTVSPDGQPPAIIQDRLKSDASTMTAVLPPPSGKLPKNGYTLCGLYEEWQALRRTTKGGTVFQRGRDVARWQALSRIFLNVGTPRCEIVPVMRAAQTP